MYLTHIHKIQNRTQYLAFNAIDEKYRMWAGIFLYMFSNTKNEKEIKSINKCEIIRKLL